MNFKQLWAYYSNEEAVESAKRLEEAGIGCRISSRDKGLFGDPATSDLIWLSVDEADYQKASDVLGVTHEGAQDGGTYHYQPAASAPEKEPDTTSEPPWTCQHCGEHSEAQFLSCWNCGTNRPEKQ